MPLAGFEPAIPESKRPQTHTLDRLAKGIGSLIQLYYIVTDDPGSTPDQKYARLRNRQKLKI
jgi:hypothetical protein